LDQHISEPLPGEWIEVSSPPEAEGTAWAESADDGEGGARLGVVADDGADLRGLPAGELASNDHG